MSERLTRRGLHRDWRTWVVVAVMLVAIGTYVATLDDSMVEVEVPTQTP
jgi:hypothetical protein